MGVTKSFRTEEPASSSNDGAVADGREPDMPPWDHDLASRWQCAEGLAGTSDETLFCLQRGRGVSWGRFADLDEAVRLLAAQERARTQADAAADANVSVVAARDSRRSSKSAAAEAGSPQSSEERESGSPPASDASPPSARTASGIGTPGRLWINVAFAGKDRLVGRDGQAWFRRLFEGQEDWCTFWAWTNEGCAHNDVLWREDNFEEFIWDVVESWYR